MTQDHTEDHSADEAVSTSLSNSHVESRDGDAAKTKIASFRLSAQAHATMTAKAAEAGISTRSWLEQAILPNRSQILARTQPHPELKPLLFQASKAGNNLNQIAHRVNVLRLEGKLIDQECTAVLDQLLRIEATFEEAVAHARAN